MNRRSSLPEPLQKDLHHLGKKVEERLGLAFSEKRALDLWSFLLRKASAEKLSPEELLRRILREDISENLERDFAQHLTVGETYFFREPRTLEALKTEVLPLFSRKGSPRIWCAGCSTGEEAYTLAMILYGPQGRPFPENPCIFGTDINPQALHKARRGIYTSWSFRNVSEISKRLFFDPLEKGSFSVKPSFRKAVSFSHCNLFAPAWPLWEKSSPPDIIFCRNVLIYFTESSREKIVERFHALLPPSGWLVVAPCETSALLGSRFAPLHLPGVTLYRKEEFRKKEEPFFQFPREAFREMPPTPYEERVSSSPPFLPLLREESLPEALAAEPPRQPSEEPKKEVLLEKARSLANGGKYPEALEILEGLLRENPTEVSSVYLCGLIHAETGEDGRAAETLRKVLFLEPDFVMAHYALGTLALKRGHSEEASRHFRNAAAFAASLPPGSILFEGEGLSREDLLEALKKDE